MLKSLEKWNGIIVLAVAGGGLFLAPAPARAQTPVDCTTLPNPVYLPGSSDIRPVLSRIAPFLATSSAGADRMTIIYRSLSSCNAIDYVLNDTDFDGMPTYWTGRLNDQGRPEEATCMMPPGVKASLAESDITVRTCRGTDPPAGFGEIGGFVQTFLFVVPPNSTQTAITATEGYFLMKFGGEAERLVPPWTNPQFIVIRNPAASTQLVVGQAIGVPGTMWSANLVNTNGGSGDVVSKVKAENTTGNAEATVGILSSQRYDQERANLKGLAFESFDQCLGAVYPDSTATALDKANVRDGHYSIWAYAQYVTKVDASGNPTDANAKKLIELLNLETEVPGINALEAVIAAGAVPTCAMKVKRAFDGAELEPYEAPEPCDCFYDKTVSGGTTCTACTTDAMCSAGGKCRFGYCEPR